MGLEMWKVVDTDTGYVRHGRLSHANRRSPEDGGHSFIGIPETAK